MTKYWPRERLLVRYAADDRLYHLRYVLNARDEGPGQLLTLLTPDRDIERVLVPSDVFLSVVRYTGRALPGIATKLLYTDAHSPAGKFDQDELEEFYAKYENEVLAPLKPRRRGKGPPDGAVVAALPIADGRDPLGPAGGAAAAEATLGADEVWVLVHGGRTNDLIGSEYDLPPGGTQIGKHYFSVGPLCVFERFEVGKVVGLRADLFEQAKHDWRNELKEWVREILAEQVLARVDPNVPAYAPGGKGGLPVEPVAGEAPVEGASGVDDIRILPPSFDEGGTRFRRLDDAVPLMRMKELADWPLDNARSTGFVVRELRKDGKTFSLAHADWVRGSGVRSNDRAVHEHKLLSKALDLAVTYDQLQIVNLASIECLVKRRMLIEDAYHGRPEAPRYDGAEFFMGFRDLDCGEYIDPAVKKYQAQRMKQETDALREFRLQREETRPAASAKSGTAGKAT